MTKPAHSPARVLLVGGTFLGLVVFGYTLLALLAAGGSL
jgi:hypothetical protein